MAASINGAWKQGRFALLEEAAHQLKTWAEADGWDEVRKAAFRLELAARKENREQAAHCIALLEQCIGTAAPETEGGPDEDSDC